VTDERVGVRYFRKHIETPNEKKKRLEAEARAAEAHRLAEVKRAEDAARREEAERARLEQEKQDKLDRKATRVEVSLRKFIGSHTAVLESEKTVIWQKKEKPKKVEKKNDSGKKKKQPTPVVCLRIRQRLPPRHLSICQHRVRISRKHVCGKDCWDLKW
jgi:hypothetical protein